MKKQIWFQTDLGYEISKQKLIQNRNVIGDMEDYKGILTFYLKDMKDFTIQITTQGKLGISYPETANYEMVLEKLKPFLVKADGSPIQKLEKIKDSETLELRESDYEFLKLCIQQGWITREEIEALSNAKVLADIYPELKPLYDSFVSDVDVLKMIKDKLKG